MMSSQKQFGIDKPMHIESLDCLNSIQTDRDEPIPQQMRTMEAEKDNMLQSYLTEKSHDEKLELQ